MGTKVGGIGDAVKQHRKELTEGAKKPKQTPETLGFVTVLVVPGWRGKARFVRRDLKWYHEYRTAMGVRA